MTALEAALRKAAGKDKALATLLVAALGGQAKVASGKAKRGRPAKQRPESTDERKAAFAEAVVKSGEKAGYKNVVPNETMLTYGKWEEKGFTVKKGEKAIRVKTAGMNGKGIPLFHRDQVEPTGSEETTVSGNGEVEQSPQVN